MPFFVSAAELGDLHGRIDELMKSYADAEEAAKECEREMARMDALNKTLELRLHDRTQEVSTHKAHVDNLRETLAMAQNQLMQRESEVRILRSLKLYVRDGRGFRRLYEDDNPVVGSDVAVTTLVKAVLDRMRESFPEMLSQVVVDELYRRRIESNEVAGLLIARSRPIAQIVEIPRED